MSAAAPSGIPTPAQRTVTALERAQTTFPELTNAKLLQAILLEVAAEASVRSTNFADQVRKRYAEATPAKPMKGQGAKPKPTPKVSAILEPLTPIKYIPNLEITLAGPLDPFFLLEAYGSHQLARALSGHSPADLRRAVTLVQERNPGTAPTSKTSKGLIAYIVAYVTEESVAPSIATS